MIFGAHFLIYSKDPEADRTFFRDVLRYPAVDVGGGWLIFKLPPSELAIHPGSGDFVQKHGDHEMLGTLFYLMCDDLRSQMKDLAAAGVSCGDILEANWGISTSVRLPSGGEIGLYQPMHKLAIALKEGKAKPLTATRKATVRSKKTAASKKAPAKKKAAGGSKRAGRPKR
jgi:hypothetical protein